MSFIRHRRATSPNKFECRNVYSTNHSKEDEITKLQRELSEKKALDKKAGIDIQKKRAEISRIDLDIESQRMLLVQKNNNKRTEISRLGAMPEKETKYRRETYYEYRGGLGILDAIWGPKERTRSVPYSDDTNQQRWKKMKSDIETKYREKENQINAQSRMLESKPINKVGTILGSD